MFCPECRAWIEKVKTCPHCGASIDVSEENIQRLKDLNEDFIEAFDKKDFEGAARCDEQFHNIILEATDNDRLVQILKNLKL